MKMWIKGKTGEAVVINPQSQQWPGCCGGHIISSWAGFSKDAWGARPNEVILGTKEKPLEGIDIITTLIDNLYLSGILAMVDVHNSGPYQGADAVFASIPDGYFETQKYICHAVKANKFTNRVHNSKLTAVMIVTESKTETAKAKLQESKKAGTHLPATVEAELGEVVKKPVIRRALRAPKKAVPRAAIAGSVPVKRVVRKKKEAV